MGASALRFQVYSSGVCEDRKLLFLPKIFINFAFLTDTLIIQHYVSKLLNYISYEVVLYSVHCLYFNGSLRSMAIVVCNYVNFDSSCSQSIPCIITISTVVLDNNIMYISILATKQKYVFVNVQIRL